MSTITFGGGPTTEARRNFSNLKYGSQVPGYRGHIHQLKYNNGHTYGTQTHMLAINNSTSIYGLDKPYGVTMDNLNFDPKSKYTLRNSLPNTSGGNKLTESMVPGYTGYIPSRKFHFSDTYRAECDQCIDGFITSKNEKTAKTNDLIRNHVQKYPKHTSITTGGEVKATLDNFKDSSSFSSTLKTDRREFTEPPIPGYTGFVPRIKPTEIGLGSRYHDATEKGLNEFKNTYIDRSKSSSNLLSASYNPISSSSNRVKSGDGQVNSRRIFVPTGMIPKYTGYVHNRKFDYGHTYGNATRDLAVCNHRYNTFGEYMQHNPPKTAIC